MAQALIAVSNAGTTLSYFFENWNSDVVSIGCLLAEYRQNRVAESRLLLSFSVIYGCIIWLAAGLVVHAWWWQFCFVQGLCYALPSGQI